MFLYILFILAIITTVFFVYKKKNIQESFSAQNYEYKFDGECDGNELRMYEGSSDNPGIPVEGTTENNMSLDGLRQACGKACHDKKTPIDGKSWSNFGDALGFVVYEKRTPNMGRCYCEKQNSSTCERKNPNGGYKRYDFVTPTNTPSVTTGPNTNPDPDPSPNPTLNPDPSPNPTLNPDPSSNPTLNPDPSSNPTLNPDSDPEQIELEGQWRNHFRTYPTCTPAGVQTNTAKCPKNCVKPQKVGGNCIGADDPTDRRGYNDNPCERADNTLFKKCNHKCLTPGMPGYQELMPTNMDDYNLESHGCRNDTQCQECGRIDVDISNSSGIWKYLDKGASGIKRLWQLHSLKFDDSNKAQGYLEDYMTKCEQDRMEGTHKNSCPADLWTPEERQRKKAEAMAEVNSSEDEKINVKAKSNKADTSTGNMFLDITNPSHIGKKDMSLEDYYTRRILNNNSENRLGGSKTAYTKQYKPDNKGRKVHYFNSVWKLF